MATIDNLSIQVTANAESAASALDRLASSAGGLRSAATMAGGGLRDLSAGAKDAGTATQEAGQQAGNAEKHTCNYGRAAEEAGKAAKRGTAGIATFWQSLKRIAFYRFVRSIIKEITEAFKEGITNLYHWSDAINGHFASAMDRLATSTQYLKNSLGAMVSPLIETLVPVLDVIIDKIVNILNFFNMLVSAISGSDTYTVAKKAAAVWDDSANKTTKATKSAANELKRTILGFDEINKLVKQSNPSSGSGSSSGKKQPDYGAMFEEKPLTGIFKKISDVTNGWPDWLKALLGVGTAALAIFGIPALLKTIWDWLKKLFALHIPDFFKWLFGPKDKRTIDIELPDHLDLPDANIETNLKKGDWSALDELSGKSVYVSPKLDNKGGVLFNKLKDEWNAARTPLYDSPKLDNTGAVLWNRFKKEWDDAGSKTLYLSPKFDNGAETLYTNFKNEWDNSGSKTLYFSPKLDNTAKALYDGFVKAWDKVGSKTLYFSPKLDNSGIVLWNRFKKEWDNAQTSLYASPKLNNTANVLWGQFKKAWDSVSPTVKVALELDYGNGEGSGNGGGNGIWSILKHFTFIDELYDLFNPKKPDTIVGPGGKTSGGGVGRSSVIDPSTNRSGILGAILDIFDPVAYAEDDGGAMAKAQAAQTANAFKTMFDGTSNNTKIVGRVGGNLVGSATKLTKALNENTSATKVDSNGYLPYTFGTASQAEFNSAWNEFVGDGFNVNATVDFSPKDSTVGAYKNRGMLGYLKELFAPGVTTENRVQLLRQGWDSVSKWVSGLMGNTPVAQKVGLLKNLWDTVSGWVNGFRGNTAINQNIGLFKLWDTVSGWVYGLRGNTDVNQNVGLSKVWDTVSGWVNGLRGNTTINQSIGLSKVWDTVSGWVNGLRGDTAVNQTVGLLKNAWSTVSLWVYGNKGNTAVDQDVGLSKSWTTVAGWILASFMGGDVEKYVGLTNDAGWSGGGGWKSVVAWVKENLGNGDVDQLVGLMGKGWSYVYEWVNERLGGINATAGVDLTNSGTNWARGIVWFLTKGKDIVLGVSLAVKSVSGAVASIVNAILGKAIGGVFQNGVWQNIPQYAGGTTNAHGSLFLAGEAGPEIVGHVGGRTEVLNKSQLAATMYAAVHSAMQGVRVDAMFYDGSTDGSDGTDYDTMYRAMYDAFTAAMARGDERDVEKVALLRQISEKDFTANVSTADINRSQRYMNRRAGVTVVPVNG